MSKILLVSLFVFAAVAQALPFTLNCKVTGTKSEVAPDDLKTYEYEYLNNLLGAKTAQINVDGEYTVLKMMDAYNRTVSFQQVKYDSSRANSTIIKSETATLKQYVSKGYEKLGEVAFYNDELAPVDQSYGAHFDLVFKKADLERGTGAMDVRIWTASIGEPDDDTGKQNLYENTNWSMSCKAR